ncbi:DNA glycosylase AlkZ-like family protein [Agrococcus sp. SGAir0287]|uniref:DNA glycosylase AlkZ-like family protein n=1 Tax=Agrococcus sp. SGAir0287 TaxID=2070347 RepID=UPI0010CD66A3|nr:crosslink repair DNA glycosylase YcaQ family protein [Agrococcus sp. SGAir0287]QCR19088.1 winged helix-turn-helix domain-containing protein [Agrococcus sp. SGAir0287]
MATRAATLREIPLVEARRIAVRAQLLDARGLGDLLSVVEHLGFLQANVTDIVMPSAEHVAWSRLGDEIAYADVRRAVEVEQRLFEHLGQPTPIEPLAMSLRPTSLLPELLPAMRSWGDDHPNVAAWVEQNAAFRDRVLDLLHDDGPLPQRAVPDTADWPWDSSGWNANRNVAMLLEFLQCSGVVAVVERIGSERVWDLAERVLPPAEPLDPDVAVTRRHERVLASLGLARPRVVGDVGEPVRVEGTRGEWRLARGATAEGFTGRVAVLSPLDRLIFDRKRMRELFAFDYALEQYTPAARRRWGAFALPVLDGDALVAKVDARRDRDAGVLRVAAIHWDLEPDARLRDAVASELARMAAFLGVGLALP